MSGTAAPAFYPQELVKAILRGIRDTADAEEQEAPGEENCPKIIAATIAAQHMPATQSQETVTAMKAQELEKNMERSRSPSDTRTVLELNSSQCGSRCT